MPWARLCPRRDGPRSRPSRHLAAQHHGQLPRSGEDHRLRAGDPRDQARDDQPRRGLRPLQLPLARASARAPGRSSDGHLRLGHRAVGDADRPPALSRRSAGGGGRPGAGRAAQAQDPRTLGDRAGHPRGPRRGRAAGLGGRTRGSLPDRGRVQGRALRDPQPPLQQQRRRQRGDLHARHLRARVQARVRGLRQLRARGLLADPGPGQRRDGHAEHQRRGRSRPRSLALGPDLDLELRTRGQRHRRARHQLEGRLGGAEGRGPREGRPRAHRRGRRAALSNRSLARDRRDGGGLRRDPPRAGQDLRAQDPPRRLRPRSRHHRSLRPRGSLGHPDWPPQHHRRARHRHDGGRRPLLRDGAARGHRSRHGDPAVGAAGDPPGRPHRSADLAGAGRCPRRQHHPSRPQVGERGLDRQGRRPGLRQGARLRHLQADRHDQQLADDPGHGHGLARLHGARAGRGRARQRAVGHLRARHDLVRDADGSAALHGSQRDRRLDEEGRGSGARGDRAATRGPRAAGRGRRALPGPRLRAATGVDEGARVRADPRARGPGLGGRGRDGPADRRGRGGERGGPQWFGRIELERVARWRRHAAGGHEQQRADGPDPHGSRASGPSRRPGRGSSPARGRRPLAQAADLGTDRRRGGDRGALARAHLSADAR